MICTSLDAGFSSSENPSCFTARAPGSCTAPFFNRGVSLLSLSFAKNYFSPLALSLFSHPPSVDPLPFSFQLLFPSLARPPIRSLLFTFLIFSNLSLSFFRRVAWARGVLALFSTLAGPSFVEFPFFLLSPFPPGIRSHWARSFRRIPDLRPAGPSRWAFSHCFVFLPDFMTRLRILPSRPRPPH